MPTVESASCLLRQARELAGMTQAEVAARGGTTQSVISAYESGRREPSLPVLIRLLAATGHALDGRLVAAEAERPAGELTGVLGRRVRRRRRAIMGIADRYGARNVRIFGSVARGTERPGSDIDVLVDLPEGTGLFTLGRLRRDLEELLGAPVDVVPASSVKPDVRARIAADLVEL